MTLPRMLLILCAAALSCVPAEPNLEGRPCPCVEGYVCVDETCRLETDGSNPVEADAAMSDTPRFDAGRDGASEDARLDVASDADDRDIPMSPDVPAGPDAGPPFDGGADAGPPFDAGPPPFDAGPPLSFCERHGVGSYACLDFDEAPPAAWMSVETGGGQLRFDSSPAISGRSLRVSGAALAEAHYERIDVGNVSSGTVWLRMRVFVEAGGTDNTSFPLLSLSQRLTEPYTYLALVLRTNGRIRTLLSRGGLGTVEDTSSPATYVTGRWHCLETEFEVSGSTSVVTYVDGSEISRFTGVTTGTYDRIHVGADVLGTDQSARNVWLDDVIWSPTRVRCGLE